MKQCAGRLVKLIQQERNTKVLPKADFVAFTVATVEVFSGYSQFLDLYSDVWVTYVIYWASMEAQHEAAENDYMLALIVCFVSLASTFMATQSSVIGMKFAQGDFEPQNFNKMSCLTKLMNFLTLTIIGAFLFVIIEVLDNLKNILKLVGLLFAGSKGVERVKNFFNIVKSKLTGLNTYQLNSIEQQRKVFALYFENVPYTILLVCIQFGLLDCEEL